ncbi:hypothetical protein ACI65C_010025, partial [Semiaphis heraclei]
MIQSVKYAQKINHDIQTLRYYYYVYVRPDGRVESQDYTDARLERGFCRLRFRRSKIRKP